MFVVKSSINYLKNEGIEHHIIFAIKINLIAAFLKINIYWISIKNHIKRQFNSAQYTDTSYCTPCR